MSNNTLGWQWVAGCGAGSHRVSQPMGCGLAHLDGLVAVAFDERLHGGGDGESLPLGGGRDNFEFGGCRTERRAESCGDAVAAGLESRNVGVGLAADHGTVRSPTAASGRRVEQKAAEQCLGVRAIHRTGGGSAADTDMAKSSAPIGMYRIALVCRTLTLAGNGRRE